MFFGIFVFDELEFSNLLDKVPNGILLSTFMKTLAQVGVYMLIDENEIKWKVLILKGNHILLKTEMYHSNGPVNATSKLIVEDKLPTLVIEFLNMENVYCSSCLNM